MKKSLKTFIVIIIMVITMRSTSLSKISFADISDYIYNEVIVESQIDVSIASIVSFNRSSWLNQVTKFPNMMSIIKLSDYKFNPETKKYEIHSYSIEFNDSIMEVLNYNQIKACIAHEFGHIILKHLDFRVNYKYKPNKEYLEICKNQEFEADEFAINLLIKMNLSVEELTSALSIIDPKIEDDNNDHPSMKDRIDRINEYYNTIH